MTKVSLPKEEKEHLIEAVKKRDAIWNKNTRFHSSQIVVSKLWKEVAEELQLPIYDVKRQWKNLRDLFRIELRKNSKYWNGNKNVKLKSSWYYFDMLLFLKDQIKRGNTKLPSSDDEEIACNIKNKKPLTSFSKSKDLGFGPLPCIKPKTEEDSNDPFEIFDEPSKSEISFQGFEIEPPSKKFSQSMENTYSKNQKLLYRNESAAFFESLVPHMENMKPERKLLCRIELQKIVYQFAYENNE